jgi:polyisoprenoid-binding protein YceI
MTTNLATRSDYRTGIWKLDPTHSELTFSVRHLAISKVRGSFERFTATIVTAEDPTKSTVEASIEDPSQISVVATVDVASVTTGQAQRDGHLHSSDFFLIEEHPTMTFTSTGITVDGDGFSLVGDLTLRGVTKSVTLKGEFGGIVTDGYGQTKAGASASTKINRHDFGVSWNAALEAGGFTLGDDVTINLDVQVVLQPEDGAAA